MDREQCHMMINNRTTLHLSLANSETSYGSFTLGPVQDIPPHTEVKAFAAAGNFGPAGTTGSVTYQLGDDANVTVAVMFDIPTTSSQNTVKVVSSHPDVAVQLSDFNGTGPVESCTAKVVDGR